MTLAHAIVARSAAPLTLTQPRKSFAIFDMAKSVHMLPVAAAPVAAPVATDADGSLDVVSTEEDLQQVELAVARAVAEQKKQRELLEGLLDSLRAGSAAAPQQAAWLKHLVHAQP